MALGSIASNSHYHPYQRQQTLQQQPLSTYTKQQQPRAIAPAPLNAKANGKTATEKFYGGASGTTLESNNPAVVRRNARERNRVKQVNCGFTYLRQHLPPAIVADLSNGRRGIGPGAHKKLSKVDTLRMAVEYIRRLKGVIDEVDAKRASPQVQTSTWSNVATSATNSPPPTPNKNGTHVSMLDDKMQQHFQTLSYAGTQQQQQQQLINQKYQQPQLQPQFFNQYTGLISPAGSVSSSTGSDCNNSDHSTFYSHHSATTGGLAAHQHFSLPLQMKYEHQYIEEQGGVVCSSGDEEDLLDYISLWQDEV